MEPPVPPSVNDGRITRGKPSWSQRRSASFALFTNADAGTSRPILRQASLNHRSEEHTSELQSRLHLVCRLLLEKKKKNSTSSGARSAGCGVRTTPRLRF